MADRTTFTYAIYISAKAETVWKALLDGEFTRQYWGHDNVSDWKPGSTWEHRRAAGDRAVAILGEVVEANPPHRLVLTWADPKDKADRSRHSRVQFDIEDVADMVRLTVTHEQLDAEMGRKISEGWPRVLSSLKSLLERGKPLDTWAGR
jgi:uncharacterized protein YndB with AHSA1/START domain